MDTDEKFTMTISVVVFIALSVGFYFVKKQKSVNNEAQITRNFHASISETNFDEQSFSSGKSHTPQLCNSVLFKSIDGEYKDQYFKLNSCQSPGYFILTDSWVYNHRKNDTVYFKTLFKRRFFEIKER